MARPRNFQEQTVLAAARDLFWKKGYTATSLTDLEAATGLKRTSLYQAFGNKDELYQRVLGEYRDYGQSQLQQLLASGKTPAEGIRNLFNYAVQVFTDDAERKGCFTVNATAERGGACELTTLLVADNRDNFTQVVASHLAGEAAGAVQVEKSRITAATLYAFYCGLSILAKSGTSKADMEQSVDLQLGALGF